MTSMGSLISAKVVQDHLKRIIKSAGSAPLGPAELTAINAGEDMGLLTVDSRVEGLPTGITWTSQELPIPETSDWRRHPNYGDLMTIEEFREHTSYCAITPDDGSGEWATEDLVSNKDCFGDPPPPEATHVMWYSK